MVQFNLLPDIKIQYLKARRQKRMIVMSSTVVSIATVVILLMFTSFVFGVQKKSVSDLNRDIEDKGNQLTSTQDLDKILTVQNQLNAMPDLHDDKAVANRLFGYVSQVTPNAAGISRLNVDFVENIITISGAADTLETVNQFADTLKFTAFTTEDNKEEEKSAFSEVVLSNFGRDNQGASYTIIANFDPVIFSELEEVTLTVPNIVTTRSEVAQPSALFQKSETGQ